MTARKPIAVATNDSPQSQAAGLWAAQRAEYAGLPLVKYFGKASMMLVGPGTGHFGVSPADRPLQVAAVSRVPVAVVGTRDTNGRSSERGPVETLVGAAVNAGMLVVGSRGRGAIKRILLGSKNKN